jgi:hypothetical protein
MGHSVDIQTARLFEELNTTLIHYPQTFPKEKLDVQDESSKFVSEPDNFISENTTITCAYDHRVNSCTGLI